MKERETKKKISYNYNYQTKRIHRKKIKRCFFFYYLQRNMHTYVY
jgi:hypothetical protein